jgi:predicted nucleic acid-binding protein
LPLPAEIVADANVILSALIGGRAGHVFSQAHGPKVYAPSTVRDEVREYLPQLAAKKHLSLPLLLIAFDLLFVSWVDDADYVAQETEARRRMNKRDPDDWPLVALALSRSSPIWSQDKDLSESGLIVYTTGDLLDLLRS